MDPKEKRLHDSCVLFDEKFFNIGGIVYQHITDVSRFRIITTKFSLSNEGKLLRISILSPSILHDIYILTNDKQE